MRLAAIDVGMGTQDILIYDSRKSFENSFKMVLPSQTQIIASKIAKETKRKNDIVLVGETMGGGASSMAVKRHLEAKLSIFATKKAALTLNDDLEKAKEMGVVIISEDEADELHASRIEMCDVDIFSLKNGLGLFGVALPQKFAVAVQDHGYSPEKSNRIFRFEYFRRVMETNASLDRFVYRGNVPKRFTRMKAVERTLACELLMDTGMAAIRGALLDANANSPALVVNIGNGHTLAGVVENKRLLSLLEHHTHLMSSNILDDYLKRLCDGELDFQEVFDAGGHGCHISEAVGFKNIRSILVTGPKRSIMRSSKLDFIYAAPFGDMMLTGCFGLVDAYLHYISG